MAIDRELTAEEAAWLKGKPYRKGRYGNVARKTEYKGVKYDSQLEASQACELDVELQQGRVDWWLRQVTIPLGPDFKTRVDFLVAKPIVCQNSNVATHIFAIEVKGFETREFAKVRRLWEKYGPFDLKIVKKNSEETITGKQ